MDQGIVNAFKKIEDKIANEKLQKERAIELQRIKEVHEAAERKRKFQERLIYSGSFFFIFTIFAVVYITNEDQIRQDGGIGNWATNVVSGISLSGVKVQVDCSDINNWKDPACMELRKTEIEDRWADMAIKKGGKDKPFAINNNK